VLFVAAILVGVVLGLVTEEPVLGLVVLGVLLVAGAAILVWSERAARG
jgi:hypothetical protein